MTKIVSTDSLQRGYSYELLARTGKGFAREFRPQLTPKEMLALGVFGGAYFADGGVGVYAEFPKSWFVHAKFSKDGKQHKELNYFNVLASQSREEWQKKGWIHKDDPRGWFQWYCRYYLGRRHADDARQIKRWQNLTRHLHQIAGGCRAGDMTCRPRQRQAVLHWAYDSRKI